MIHLICMFEFFSSGSCFILNFLTWYFIGVTFFLHCLVYFEKKTLVIFVSMLPWITEYIALPSLALSSLFCWHGSKSRFVHSLSKKVKIPRVGFHDCCFSQDKSSQKCNRKPSPIKELVWRCLCFLSWKPKSCLHLMVHIVLVTQCFSFLSFWNHKFINGLCSRLP